MTVSPSTGLGDRQFVNVSWTGYNARQAVFFRQCTASPTNVNSQCTALYPDAASPTPRRRQPLRVRVRRQRPVCQRRELHLRRPDALHVGVFTKSTLASGTLIPISSSDPRRLPGREGRGIAGGGADGANRAIYGWTVDVCEPPTSLGVNYISANSQDGRDNFINGLNDFAVTGDPFTADELTQLKQKGKTFAYAPVTSSALVLAYKIFNQDATALRAGAQVTDLKLTPQLVTQIFTGQLLNWHSSTDISNLNPGDIFPP